LTDGLDFRNISLLHCLGFGAVALLGTLLAGCGGAENRPAKWSFIAPAIIEPNCGTVSCHSSVAQRAGVILDSREAAYTSLVNRGFVVKCKVAGDTVCTSSAAATSEVLSLLRGQGSPRMPPDFALPDPDISLIEAWINNGALDD
jgi:hypothetical protein